MKKIILTFCFSLLMSMIAFGQTVNGIPIKEIDAEFMEIVGAPTNLLHSFPIVYFDFGQAKHPYNLHNEHFVMKEKDGKVKAFKNMVEALNFMNKNGYIFVQAYVMHNGDFSECHYLMKKKNYKEKASPVNSAKTPDTSISQ